TANSTYPIDCGCRARDRCNAGDMTVDCSAANGLFVEERFATKGCVDNQINLSALDVVHDVGTSFVYFVNGFNINAGASKNTCRSSRCNNFEPNFDEVCRDLRNKVLVVLIDADEGHTALWQHGSGADLSLDVGLAKRIVDPHDLAGRFHFGTENRIYTLESCEWENR